MFAKLLKHEWKANGGLLSILSLGALGAGLLGAFVLKGLIYIQEQNAQEDAFVWSTLGLSSALTFIIIALVAYAFAVQFITLFRFYKNKFTDEGYLTFTLPVTAPQIFLSSFLYILFWLVISVLVLIGAFSMIVFIGAAGPIKEYAWEIRVLLESLTEAWPASQPGYGFYTALRTVMLVITPMYSVILLMTSIVIGCVLAKKHKILATIGAYYVLNFVVGIAESILGVGPLILMTPLEDETYLIYMAVGTMILNILLYIGLAVGGYILSTRLMKNKLNLP